MATRPVFCVCYEPPFTDIREVDFQYYSGMALSQAQKSIRSLHQACEELYPELKNKIMEISTKSTSAIGAKLSAFNLMYKDVNGALYSVENVFQAGKCFENGQQYIDLLNASAYEAKKDPRLRKSGKVLCFKLGDDVFPTYPNTFFYDWIYINALNQNTELSNEIIEYDAFTDIAFNPKKSINCQAKSASLFVSLHKNGLLQQAISSKDAFQKLIYTDSNREKPVDEQLSMFDYLG